MTGLALAAAMFVLAGTVCVLLGILAEMVLRAQYDSQDRKPYLVQEQIGNGLSPA